MSPLLSSLMARVEGAEQPLAESVSEGVSGVASEPGNELVVKELNEGDDS